MSPSELLKTKADAQMWHFIARARERFRIKLTVARYHRLIRQVEDSAPGTSFLRHQPPERTIWIIRAAGHDMRVVYDHTTARLITCLPYGPMPRARSQLNPHKLRRLRTEGRKWR